MDAVSKMGKGESGIGYRGSITMISP